MRSVVVVGASLAGISAARALRAQGFDGRLALVGEEHHRPYDRPPLSKEFLAGRLGVDGLRLSTPDDDALDLEWRLGARAVSFRPRAGDHVVALGDSSGVVDEIRSDGVVVATGGRARSLPTRRPGSPPAGVHTLRTLDDALALRADLVPGARLVVVGAGFIGAEVASTARGLGLDVTVVEAGPAALAIPLGPHMGRVCSRLHADHGVRLITGVGVAELEGREAVTAVLLADGRSLPADVVVVAVGSAPNTEWLAGSGLSGPAVVGLAGGVLTDDAGATGVPGVVATGDVAARYEVFAGHVVRGEHWTDALGHPALATATLLGVEPPVQRPVAAVPYFWSDQYGRTFQFAGHRNDGDVEEIVDGAPGSDGFVCVYRRHGLPVAVLGLDRPKVFTRWRRDLAARRTEQVAAVS